MIISTKTEYAVRALVEIAKQAEQKPISISDICRKADLPQKYIEQIFRKLKQHQIVESIHGSKGGYMLAKPEKKISLNDIMNAVEENYNAEYCDGNPEHHSHCIGLPCGFHDLWNEIRDYMVDYLKDIKLDYIISRF